MTPTIPLYASVGSNDVDRALVFYTELPGSIGLEKVYDNPAGGASFGLPFTGMLTVVRPFDGKPATVGNGTMIGFALPTNDLVDGFHGKALSLEGMDDGTPGERGGAYLAYFRDPEGNKLCGYHIG